VFLHRKVEKNNCTMHIRELEKEKFGVSSVKSCKLGNFRRRKVVFLHKKKTRKKQLQIRELEKKKWCVFFTEN
jgi:hypothetical protein